MPGGLFSVALSRSLQTVGVTHHGVLWSPDFPRIVLPQSAIAWPAAHGTNLTFRVVANPCAVRIDCPSLMIGHPIPLPQRHFPPGQAALR